MAVVTNVRRRGPRPRVVLVNTGALTWQEKSECFQRRLDPRALDPKSDQYDVDAARAACNACQVVAQCRAAAESDPEFEGTAGGEVYDTKRRGKRMVRVAIRPDGRERIIPKTSKKDTTAREVAA